MWRNFREDWDRRKTYLIRSLFQEIPLLSPVPEDQESRFGSVSPSDVPGSRPHSPLPPLIIEKLPSRHDHPSQFYDELERKMKKLYKKLFLHGDGSSSIEDLIQQYSGGDLDDARSQVTVTAEQYHENDNSITLNLQSESDNTNFVTAYKVRSNSESDFSKSTSSDADSNVIKSSTVSSIQPDESHNYVTDDNIHKDIQSRTEKDREARVTTQVVVHEISTHYEVDVPLDSPVYEDRVKCSSPIIKLKPRRHHHIEEKLENVELGSEKVSNRHSLDSEMINNIQQEELSGSSDTNHTNEGIEIMRRQQTVSPLLGSMQNDPNDTETSSIGANVGIKRKASCELDPSECSFERDAAKFKDITFSRESHNFDDILAVPSDNSSTNFNTDHRSFMSFSRHALVDSVTPTKRIKFGNTSVQTSLPDEDESLNWNTVKNNFFVGIPRIYKLCSCDQHFCENQM